MYLTIGSNNFRKNQETTKKMKFLGVYYLFCTIFADPFNRGIKN